jgi:hypothetical protein
MDSFSAAAAATANPLPSSRMPYKGRCTLCDEDYSDWTAHSSKVSHVARETSCAAFVVPERHDAMMSQLWDHIQLDFKLIDQLSSKKIDRRRTRLTSTLQYLVDQGVLSRSIPCPADSDSTDGRGASSVSADFCSLVGVGEAWLMSQTMDSAARLLPRVPPNELMNMVDYMTQVRQLRRLYESLRLGSLIPPSTGALAADEKVAVMLAMLGELRMYTNQDHNHVVSSMATANKLVYNVLASHCAENIVSELVHSVLQRLVDEGTAVWREYKGELSAKLFTEGDSGAVSSGILSEAPSEAPKEISMAMFDSFPLAAEQEVVEELTADFNIHATWSPLNKSTSLDLAPPRSRKNSFYAPIAPKIASKRR